MNKGDVFRLSLAGELAEGKIIFVAPVLLETFFSCSCAVCISNMQQHDPSDLFTEAAVVFWCYTYWLDRFSDNDMDANYRCWENVIELQ